MAAEHEDVGLQLPHGVECLLAVGRGTDHVAIGSQQPGDSVEYRLVVVSQNHADWIQFPPLALSRLYFAAPIQGKPTSNRKFMSENVSTTALKTPAIS